MGMTKVSLSLSESVIGSCLTFFVCAGSASRCSDHRGRANGTRCGEEIARSGIFPFFSLGEMKPVKWADMGDRNIAIGLLSMHSKRLEDLRPRT